MPIPSIYPQQIPLKNFFVK